MAPAASESRAAAVGRPSPPLSVVLCTKDRPDDLLRAVATVRACGEAGRRAEIVVVEEAAAPRPVPGVRYVHLPPEGRGFAHARNVGVAHATGEIVAFLDDDCEAEAGWLEALVAPLADDPALLGVAGAVLVRSCGAVGYAENILGFPGGGLRYLYEAGGRIAPTRYLSTCNCAYRREAIHRAGGFPERGRMGGEDFLLAERIAALGSCVYTPHAVVYHRPRGRLRAVFAWFVRRGQGEMLLRGAVAERRAFRAFLLRSSWTVRALVLGALLLWWPALAWWLPPAAAGYYAAMLWRFRFARRFPAHRRAWWIVPIVKLTMDLGTEVGRCKALCGRRRP
jgi:GT2 family glycosyltransferase